MQEVREAESTIVIEKMVNMTTPPLTLLALLVASSNESPLESYQKDVKKLSKINQKLYQEAMVRHTAL